MSELGRELSIACFEDRCDLCSDPACQDRCHRWQHWDVYEGWVEDDPANDTAA